MCIRDRNWTVATESVNVALATSLDGIPVLNARPFNVRDSVTFTVPPEATPGSLIVGSAPSIVYVVVAPGVASVTVTVLVVVKLPPAGDSTGVPTFHVYDGPLMAAGVARSIVVPVPSCPDPLSPHVDTTSAVSYTHLTLPTSDLV